MAWNHGVACKKRSRAKAYVDLELWSGQQDTHSIVRGAMQAAAHLVHTSRVGRMTRGKLNAALGIAIPVAMMHMPCYHATL
jgi:hypothetical protein